MGQPQLKDSAGEQQRTFANKAVDTARHGNVEVAIWRNEGSNGEFYSASAPTIRYKDGEQWKDGSNFGWPMTKKHDRTPKVSVGTVKKSLAAIASRWMRRKAQPAPGWIRILIRTPHPARNRSLRDNKPQFEQLSRSSSNTAESRPDASEQRFPG